MSKKKVTPKIRVSPKTKRQNEMLLKFLKRTKAGKYAVIEKSSIKYTRWNEEPIQSNEEEYYYGLN